MSDSRGLTTPVGQFTVTRVVEYAAPTSPRFLFKQGSREAFAPLAAGLPPGFYGAEDHRLFMPIQTMVVRTRHHTILVDTCLGNHKQRDYEPWSNRNGTYLEDLGRAGVRPDEVDYVMCTHLHVDHVGWNTRWVDGKWVPTFPKATYLFAQPEYEHWKTQEQGEAGRIYLDSIKPVVDAGRHKLVPVDFTIEDGVRFESTPGHTPGHCSLHLASSGREAIITGDMMHNPVQVIAPDWASQFDTDPAESTRTRRAFCGRYADRDVLILGTHWPLPPLRIVGKGDGWGVRA